MDQLIYMLTGAGPATLLSDLRSAGCKRYSEVKTQLVLASERVNRRAGIMQELKEDMSNIESLALARGWLPEWTKKYHQGRPLLAWVVQVPRKVLMRLSRPCRPRWTCSRTRCS